MTKPIIQHKADVFDFWTGSQFYERVYNLFLSYPTGEIRVNCRNADYIMIDDHYMDGAFSFDYIERFLRTIPEGVINCTVEVFAAPKIVRPEDDAAKNYIINIGGNNEINTKTNV